MVAGASRPLPIDREFMHVTVVWQKLRQMKQCNLEEQLVTAKMHGDTVPMGAVVGHTL